VIHACPRSLDAPSGFKFYTVSIGRRMERTYTWEQLTAPGALDFTLGR
jgi:hypothetical protein